MGRTVRRFREALREICWIIVGYGDRLRAAVETSKSLLDKKTERSYFFTVKKGETTRRRIVDEAIRLASTFGVTGLTIGGLAKSLEMSKSGLFAHFRSKEQLQLEILASAREQFIEAVVAPAIRQPRGEPRIHALFENFLEWEQNAEGGCVFISASIELDDQPGAVRDALVENRRDWLDTIGQAARIAVAEAHLCPDLDTEQFAFELWSLLLGFHHYSRLLNDPAAEVRLRNAFQNLLIRSK